METGMSWNELMEYTEWERGKWRKRLQEAGPAALRASAGPNGDSRFQCVGDLIRHIFSAEKRYVDRLSERELTETAGLPNDDIEALFQFGEQSRKDFRAFVNKFPSEQWEVTQEHRLGTSVLVVTPRKIVTHILMHEVRHWAQIATMLRMNGIKDDFHDFLFSPAMGGELRRQQVSA